MFDPHQYWAKTISSQEVLSDVTKDSNGNTVETYDGVDTVVYNYDDRNMMTSVDDGIQLVQFEYDADGARVGKAVDGQNVNYLLCKTCRYHQVMEERDDSGALLAAYTYGNQRISMSRGGDDSFYLYDGHGSVTGLANGAGLVTDSYDYSAFGLMLGSSGGTVNPYGYTGEWFDGETGLEYLRARYYAPKIGRFMSKDTWDGSTRLPLTLNKYLYANGNPVSFIDPTGNWSLIEISTVATLVGVAATMAIPSYVHWSKPIINKSAWASDQWGILIVGWLGVGLNALSAGGGAAGIGPKVQGFSGFLWRRCRTNMSKKDCHDQQHLNTVDNIRSFKITAFGISAGAGVPMTLLPGSGGAGGASNITAKDYSLFSTPWPKNFDDFDWQNVMIGNGALGFGYKNWDFALRMSIPKLGVKGINMDAPFSSVWDTKDQLDAITVPPGISVSAMSGLMTVEGSDKQ